MFQVMKVKTCWRFCRRWNTAQLWWWTDGRLSLVNRKGRMSRMEIPSHTTSSTTTSPLVWWVQPTMFTGCTPTTNCSPSVWWVPPAIIADSTPYNNYVSLNVVSAIHYVQSFYPYNIFNNHFFISVVSTTMFLDSTPTTSATTASPSAWWVQPTVYWFYPYSVTNSYFSIGVVSTTSSNFWFYPYNIVSYFFIKVVCTTLSVHWLYP